MQRQDVYKRQHLFVSLGCATENLTQAALAHGLKGEAQFGGAGDAAFVGQAADKAHWVEVAAVRTPFTTALGLTGQRPDLVVRFGRGPTLPRSLRRPVASVMV